MPRLLALALLAVSLPLSAADWPHVAVAGGIVYCRDRDGNFAAFAVGRR